MMRIEEYRIVRNDGALLVSKSTEILKSSKKFTLENDTTLELFIDQINQEWHDGNGTSYQILRAYTQYTTFSSPIRVTTKPKAFSTHIRELLHSTQAKLKVNALHYTPVHASNYKTIEIHPGLHWRGALNCGISGFFYASGAFCLTDRSEYTMLSSDPWRYRECDVHAQGTWHRTNGRIHIDIHSLLK